MAFIKKNNFKEIIVKPGLGAFKTGFKIIRNVTQKKVTDYLSSLKKEKDLKDCSSKFIPEFNKFGEIKTYWINGNNLYLINNNGKMAKVYFNHKIKLKKNF